MSGPGRCVCWSAAARPRDRHTRASLGVVDLEARPGPAAADQHRALALPPPTGTAARSSGPSGALHTVGACVASKPGQAPPPPTGTAARFSGLSGAMVGPSGALAFLFCCLWCRWCSGRRVACLVGRAAWCARGRRPARSPSAPRASLGASPRGAPWPCRHPRAPQPGSPVPPVASTPVGPVVLRTIRLVSRPALALPPPTSTAAWPRHRPRVPWQVPRPLWHRDQARRSLRRSPVVCVFWIGSSVVDRNGASG